MTAERTLAQQAGYRRMAAAKGERLARAAAQRQREREDASRRNVEAITRMKA